MANLGRECSHAEEPTAVRRLFAILRVLYLIQVPPIVMAGSMVVKHPINRVIIMGQAIDGVLRRSKCHGYGWRHEGEHSKSRHRHRDTKSNTLR